MSAACFASADFLSVEVGSEEHTVLLPYGSTGFGPQRTAPHAEAWSEYSAFSGVWGGARVVPGIHAGSSLEIVTTATSSVESDELCLQVEAFAVALAPVSVVTSPPANTPQVLSVMSRARRTRMMVTTNCERPFNRRRTAVPSTTS